MESGGRSCESSSETLAWIIEIVDFLRLYKPLLDAHVVNFFKDRLWESVDEEWVDCLRHEPVENLLKIPSGFVRDRWPASLQKFIRKIGSLVLPREPKQLHMMFPDLQVVSLGAVITQGMNLKKQHEVEILAAFVSNLAKSVGARSIVDVGAGQGYLAQVLCFEYQLPVIAIDSSSHHGSVTTARAERIKKHYAAKRHKYQDGSKHLHVPQAVTCHVLSSDTLKDMTGTLLHEEKDEPSREVEEKGVETHSFGGSNLYNNNTSVPSVVLAGLHACGDLSVTMLRTFLECKEAKALISLGCCYNLLSEDCSDDKEREQCFPLSNGAKSSGISLGKNARDLACQSAERWKSLTKDAAQQNFEVHAFRAAFQMVLDRYYPDVLITSPSIGRQGKAFRRRQMRRGLLANLHIAEKNTYPPVSKELDKMEMISSGAMNSEKVGIIQDEEDKVLRTEESEKSSSSAFEHFCTSALLRLGLEPPDDILSTWKEAQPFSELVGLYWSLRAALGPVVETLILLDRLLFLQEQGTSLEAAIMPLFNPNLSPRNVAIIARKT
ncbi:hypothetical protein H6P81_019802 [Aristolochia fimbriata]|uniref:Methyltransferase domain-containing protein n=1 Tax=Aristolochia fimbriata TaxID=158543 RepID=A0AAV7DVZ0_ARIFI|nr:hypothetical protein H6P81_019802 [Aristolochia fimbriata]